MSKKEIAVWNRACEAVARRLMQGWDDNGHWTKFIAQQAAQTARWAKKGIHRPRRRTFICKVCKKYGIADTMTQSMSGGRVHMAPWCG